MIHREIPAAFPLAVLERRFGPFVAETLFITEDVPAAVNIFDVLNKSLPQIPKNKQIAVKRVLSNKLAKLLRKMQAHNFIHRNLKGSNILIKNAALIAKPNFDPNSLEFVITDIDSVVRKKHLSEKDALRPYRRLAVLADSSSCISNTDRARFLKACLTHFGSGRPDWKTLWRKIQIAR